MSLVGSEAPTFEASAVVDGEIVEDFSLERYRGEKHVVFFFYPKDFTFVCPTELHAFQNHLEEFEERDVAVVAASTDTAEVHDAWLETPRSEGGIEGVEYPIVADTNKTIADDYGVLAGEYGLEDGELSAEGELVARRGLFLIDRDGVVQHSTVNNMPLGRNVREVLRVVDALKQVEESDGAACPAGWMPGQETIETNRESVGAYLNDDD
ncbi:redoxin domain-containing protein [Natrialbaceae archaeon A-gly3]